LGLDLREAMRSPIGEFQLTLGNSDIFIAVDVA
jgi:hypothetical protein